MAKKKSVPTATSSKKPRINGAKKGKQFERDVSNALGHIFPNAERMLEYQASGNIGVDIKGTGCFKIQCKRNAGYASISKINEVRVQDPNDIPILVTKGNHMETMAVLPFDALIRMLEVMHGLSPLLAKPEDTDTKMIHDTSTHVVDTSFKEATKRLVQEGIQRQRMLYPPEVDTGKTLCGYPVIEDSDLSSGEVSTASELRGVECMRLISAEDDPKLSTLDGIIKHIEQQKLLGHEVSAIHCCSIEDLHLAFAEERGHTIVTEDTPEVSSFSDFI